MKITVITLFPNLIQPYLSTSILGRAAKKGLVEYGIVNLRDFGEGKHLVVDDRPYGGGVGMILRADILASALKKALSNSSSHSLRGNVTKVILTSTSGKIHKQAHAQRLSQLDNLIIICGHYEGVDQRFVDKYVDEEICIGDFVLTGGEIPALAVIDSVVRLIPGVLEKEQATKQESFSEELGGLLEYPQYTRPETFEGEKVPEVLLSGNHQEITKWRKQKSLERTQNLRPDLLQNTTQKD